MRATLVYDLPTRLFHWLFAGLFLLSFIIAKTVDVDSLVYSYHMLSGLVLGSVVVWRIVWGLIGSRHARFSGFNLNPFVLKDYFLEILSGSKKRWSGHNPASSWAAIVMLLLASGLAITGYLMSTGDKEAVEDIHEFMANAFIIVVILHVTGVILHTLRHQDTIVLSMIDGKKEISDSSDSISTTHRFAALVLLALVVSLGLFLFKNFDTQTRALKVSGLTLQLGQSKAETED
ncbi:MAG: cytochrome b/b6 domain-containing protein [Bdellovibrionaceae bacterium]|nr:cytochrome b/b6 domain-containing protein [Pseudobdellovibrionaceae bacterium]